MKVFSFKTGKSRKHLFIVGAALVLLAGVYGAWPFFQDMYGSGDEIALKRKQLAKYRRVVKEGDGLGKGVIALEKVLKQGESGLLTGKTPSVAAADIQKILQKVGSESKVVIKTVRVLKPEKQEQGSYLSIPLQLTITCTIRQLKKFLYEIETSPKYLTVKEVGIRVGRRRNLGQISANITVYGFMKT